MQYRKQLLYKAIHTIHPELSVDYIETILNYVSKLIVDWSENPKTLLLNVRKLGRFYFRKGRLNKEFASVSPHVIAKGQTYDGTYDEKWLKVCQKVISMYEEYIDAKDEIKKHKHGDKHIPYREYQKLKQNEYNKNNS